LASAGSGKVVRPRHLAGEALAHWKAVVPALIAAGVVEKVDTPALVAMCELWAVYRAANALWTADSANRDARIAMIEGHKAWAASAASFGLTPTARARLRVEPPRPVDEDKARFFRKQEYFRRAD
jgi:P27 family predicted phage terminase small subunit